MSIIETIYPDGVPVDKAAVRTDDKTSKRRNMAAVDDVRNANLSGQTAGIYVRELQQFYDLDTGDTTTPDDGNDCIIDNAGNRFKRLAIGSGGDVAGDTHAASSKPVPVDNDELPLVDSAAANVLKKLTWANLKATMAAWLVSAGWIRERLTTSRTYYVRADGSDSNAGLANTSGGAFLTIQKALNVVTDTLDTAGYAVTIQVGAGTYTGAISMSRPVVGGGALTITGDTTTPSNVVISTTGATALTVNNKGVVLAIQGLKITTTTAGHGIFANNGATLNVTGNMDFGAVPTNYAHIIAQYQGVVNINVGYTISGAASYHFRAEIAGSLIQAIAAATVTITGSPAFGTAFAYADTNATIYGIFVTYSGTVTGKRYSSTLNSVINTAGSGASYFPGNSSGTTGTGGQYN